MPILERLEPQVNVFMYEGVGLVAAAGSFSEWTEEFFQERFSPQEKITETTPVLEARWLYSLEREQGITESSSIVIGDEVFPVASIPPENLEVIKLLDEWFSEPDDLGEEVWREIDQMLEEGLSFS